MACSSRDGFVDALADAGRAAESRRPGDRHPPPARGRADAVRLVQQMLGMADAVFGQECRVAGADRAASDRALHAAAGQHLRIVRVGHGQLAAARLLHDHARQHMVRPAFGRGRQRQQFVLAAIHAR